MLAGVGAGARLARRSRAGRLPILVGGTGLYLRALTQGLAAIPPIPPAIRAEAAALHRKLGGAAFRERLAGLDPVAANNLPAGDTQRLIRAYEVVRATGRPIGRWQEAGGEAAPVSFRKHPADAAARGALRRLRCAVSRDDRGRRARRGGGLIARGLDPELPAMKAVGVPELLRHLRGDSTLDEAIAAAQQATRRYAKRQMTWFRHQMGAGSRPRRAIFGKFAAVILSFIRQFLLTHRP